MENLKTEQNFICVRFIDFFYILLFYLTVIAVIHIFIDNIASAFVDIGTGLIILIILKYTSAYSCNKKATIFLISTAIFFIFLIFEGGLYRMGFAWSLLFSSFAFLLNSKKTGLIWSVSFGAIILFLLIFQNLHYIKTAYENEEISLLLSIYILMSYLIYAFQKEVDIYTEELEKINKTLENRVIYEVKKNKNKDKVLNNQAKQAQLGEMVSMIAHHWRQPLNAISASAIKLKLENDMNISTTQSINDASDFIQNKTQEMSTVINNFFEFSKPIAEDSEFLLPSAIHKALNIVNTQLSLHSIYIETEFDKEFKNKKLLGSENLFEQVLLNIFINSRDAFEGKKEINKKEILIQIDKLGNVKIQDNAGGIPPQIIDDIFNPYFTTKQDVNGTGLGLYMSRKIMRTHFNGDLTYMPVIDGSCFKITFGNYIEQDSENV
ncbi:HAMP domain-containing histidine kinase [Candidatus Sulfurimonas marisnigri]|uniref:histidine kinase n=1 Tax=Candidatus Sulfurimonas marisnigri TaxID=2740405 RepID=A0A7S7RR96_9BACT|nr:HAMP domain-containing sensor histidine kinase [Candidatus Sulfurimonas marisnigri]QOY55305.1 HAMP domain-containing histidine kinase [Candidatus Sulfurimonas marisnigri]